MDVAPFVRGVAFPAAGGVPYPRADPADAGRLPADTWAAACIPVGVRLELVGDADAVEIEYRTTTDDMGYRGDGAGRTFTVWRDGRRVAEEKADLGEGSVRLPLGTVYLPEGMKPEILSVDARGGSIEPAPRLPRWVCYGDSIAEGWIASHPDGAWPAIAAREQGLDVVNLGYAGAARGEIVSAEHVAALAADVISISHGTNCWTRVPHSREQLAANTRAFLEIVRQGHPETPIVVCSPVLRPDAEDTPNKLGATLADLRAAIEEVATDAGVTLVSGDGVLEPDHLADGIHPGDEGHRILAEVFGAAVAAALVGT